MIKFCKLCSILLVLGFSAGTVAQNEKPCTTWNYKNDNECECGSSLDGVVLCNNDTHKVNILECFCMTSNGDSGNYSIVGRCIFNCANRGVIYHPVSPNITDLDDKSCGYLNRKGRLCGECKDNFSLPAYSYSFQCIECPETSWPKYIAVAFIPLTGFYFLIIFFSVSAPSPKLKSFCSSAQFIASAQNVRIILQSLYSYPKISAPLKVVFSLYGFWSLDFFRTILPPICLPISTLQALTLDYIIAGYPLFLLAVSYLLITIYDRDYPLIIKMWKPFQMFFIRFKRQWNLKTSIISTFATFILLSNEKLLSVSFDLLVLTNTYNVKGERVGVYLYYDPSVEYMGKEHRPFAIMAIIILIVTAVLPLTLFTLYPMIWFQKCLNHFHLNSQTLRVFMDCFQGYYCNYTEEGRECRYMATVYFLMRPLLLFFYAITLDSLAYLVFSLILTLFGTIFLFSQPYKQKFSVFNKVEGTMILSLALMNGGISLLNFSILIKHYQFIILAAGIMIVTALLPLVYISVLTLHWFHCRREVIKQISTSFLHGCDSSETQAIGDGEENDQLLDPSYYN